jgi:hypothetical protein
MYDANDNLATSLDYRQYKLSSSQFLELRQGATTSETEEFSN